MKYNLEVLSKHNTFSRLSCSILPMREASGLP
jgi:hypothetical protein